MPKITKASFLDKVFLFIPTIILIISVLNEFDFNYLELEYFSFNFSFILIFFFTLKNIKYFDYLLIFLAGFINDVVVSLPLGISSLSYMLICVATSYLRSVTIRPNLIKDWFFFLGTISLINSINYLILSLIFLKDLDYTSYVVNNFFTFLLYVFFVYFFNIYLNLLSRKSNV